MIKRVPLGKSMEMTWRPGYGPKSMTAHLKGPSLVLLVGVSLLLAGGCSDGSSSPQPPVGAETLQVVIDSPTAGQTQSIEGATVTVTGQAISSGIVTSVVVNGASARFVESVPTGACDFLPKCRCPRRGALRQPRLRERERRRVRRLRSLSTLRWLAIVRHPSSRSPALKTAAPARTMKLR